MLALNTLLAAVRGQDVLAGTDVRDASNRSNRDWPLWEVEFSHTYAHGVESCRIAATIAQACSVQEEIGALTGSWRAEVWIDVAPNRLDLRGSQLLADGDLATPTAFLAVVVTLLDYARMALAQAAQQ
ncbi:hypothetical protein GCM10027422_07540 [Hymenobacter arcticus]